jgi:hypothetical protein
LSGLAAFAHRTTRIALHPDGWSFTTSAAGSAAQEIETVRWERSSGVSAAHRQRSVKLRTGHESQLRANKIRAWLKQPGRASSNARRRGKT